MKIQITPDTLGIKGNKTGVPRVSISRSNISFSKEAREMLGEDTTFILEFEGEAGMYLKPSEEGFKAKLTGPYKYLSAKAPGILAHLEPFYKKNLRKYVYEMKEMKDGRHYLELLKS